MSDPMKVNPLIGSDKDFKSLANYVHGKGMKLMTWWNPSYIWAGSPLFKQAEADMRKAGGDVSRTPSDSPARFFRWGPLDWGNGVTKPDEPPLYPPGSNDDTRDQHIMWVTDADAGASYLTRYGMQPCADFSSKAWQKKFRAIAKHWIDMGIDGFVLDDPSGYIGAGSLWGADDFSWANVGYDAGKTMRSAVTEGNAYAIMRYDAIGNGEVGIAVYNLSPKKETISVTMPAAAIGQSPTDLISGKQLSTLGETYDVEVPGFGYVLLGKMWPGQWKSEGFKNCFEGAGASGSSKPVHGTLSIAACMDRCLWSDKSDCGGVTVAWTKQGDGTVECYLRSNIDISQCEDGQKDKDQWYTTFTRD